MRCPRSARPVRRGSAPGRGVWRGPGGGRDGRGREPRGRRWPWCAGGRGGTPAPGSPYAWGSPAGCTPGPPIEPGSRWVRDLGSWLPESEARGPALGGGRVGPPKLGAARGTGPRTSQLGARPRRGACYSSAPRCPHGIPTWPGVPRLIPPDHARGPSPDPGCCQLLNKHYFDDCKQTRCSERLAELLSPNSGLGFFFNSFFMKESVSL